MRKTVHFRHLSGPRMLIRCVWGESDQPDAISFCMDLKQAKQVHSTITDPEDRKSFKLICAFLPDTSDEKLMTISGPVSRSFISVINNLETVVHRFAVPTHRTPQFFAMWSPFQDGTVEPTVFWFHPQTGYQVAVVFSVDQFAKIQRELDWVSADIKTQLRESAWRVASRKGEVREPIRLTGAPARLICIGLLFNEAAKEMRSAMN